MKILIAAGIYPPDSGGPAIHAKAQFENFPKMGVKTKLIALAHYRHYPRWLRHLLYSLVLFFKSFGVDIIYAHDAWGVGFIALVGARLLRKKFVLRIGGDIPWERGAEQGTKSLSMNEWYQSGAYKTDRFFRLTRFVISRADLLIVPSSILKDLYVNYYGVKETKIKVIANPVSEKRSATPATEKTIIYASRLVAYKNLALVLEVLADVFPRHPEVRFIVMGDGPEKENLTKLAHDLKIEKNVQFTGLLPQAVVLEKTSTCLFALAPALTEFNPNYVLQGISFGKPFLISRENGLPFAIPEQFLFTSRNKAELKEKLLFLLSPTGYQVALAEVESLAFNMTWEDNLKANLEVIQSLI